MWNNVKAMQKRQSKSGGVKTKRVGE